MDTQCDVARAALAQHVALTAFQHRQAATLELVEHAQQAWPQQPRQAVRRCPGRGQCGGSGFELAHDEFLMMKTASADGRRSARA